MGLENFPTVPGQNGGVWTCIQLPPRQRRQPVAGRRGAYGGGGGVVAAHKGLLPPPPPHSRPDSSKTSGNLKLNVIVMNMGFNDSY